MRILEISQHNFIGFAESSRNFCFPVPSKRSLREYLIRRMINKKLPDVKRNGCYYPKAVRHSYFYFCEISDPSNGTTRNICVTCIFHGANGFPVTIVNTGGSIPFLQDDREYSRLSAKHSHPSQTRKPEGRWEGRAGGGNWKSLAAISLSILYYRLDIAWKRRNVVCNKSSLAIPD